MKLYLLAGLGVATLSACGTSVKLDPVPIEDKAGVPVTVSPTPAAQPQGNEVGTGQVTTVNLGGGMSEAEIQSLGRLVYFDYDSFVIRPEFQTVIESHSRVLKAQRTRKVVIGGHTDERGGREYNLALGQKRAEAVRQALSLQGVLDAQLEAVSFGEEKPADAAGSEAAMAKNRRAEISYR
jgi:peptidoglycan-associated lipoprotein